MVCLVSERINSYGFSWNWKTQTIDKEIANDLGNLCLMIQEVNTQPVHNGFRFTLTSNGNYSVSTLHNKIDRNISPHIGIKINWSKVIPLKIRCFAQRATLDRLPLATNLMARGIKV